MDLNQRIVTMIMHEGWGEEFAFQTEDNHAYYFKSDDQEVKIIKDYEERGCFIVEGRELGQEDWLDWDIVDYEEAEAMVATAEVRERKMKKEQEFTM